MKKLLPHQSETVRGLVKVLTTGSLGPSGGSAIGPLLGDQMGFGKTASAIAAAQEIGMRRILVVAPANSIRPTWVKHIKDGVSHGRDLGLPIYVIDAKAETRTNQITRGWVLLNYELLSKHRDELRAREWDLLIVDEADYLKNPKALRTREILTLNTQNAMLLTGTPIRNRPDEMFTLLYLDKQNYPNLNSFLADHYDWHVVDANKRVTGELRDPEAFQQHLRHSLMLRRTQDDLDENDEFKLKPPIFNDLPVDPSCLTTSDLNWFLRNSRAIKIVKDHINRLNKKFRKLVSQGGPVRNPEALSIAAEITVRTAQLHGLMSKNAQYTGDIKYAAVREHLLGLKQKTLVFCQHLGIVNDLMNDLHIAGRKVVSVTGKTPRVQVEATIDRFQSDDDLQFFIGTYGASGVSHTLTAASNIVLAERQWNDPTEEQALCRAHRYGQEKEVHVTRFMLELEESIDTRMAGAREKKRDITKRVLNKRKP